MDLSSLKRDQRTAMGVSLQHARVFRQLRRLQALCRLVTMGISSWEARCNRDETWRAIRHAVGFPGRFGMWWGATGLQPPIPCLLPLYCPEPSFVVTLFEGFRTYMAHYEQQLVSCQYQYAKQRRTNLKHVFKDCRADPLPQADTLLDRVAVGVEEVRD